jgi:hypothetical protein
MEATYSSETSVDFQWTTRRYIPQDIILHWSLLAWLILSTQKMETIYGSKTLVIFYKTARRYKPDHSTLRNRRSENLKSNVVFMRFEVCMAVKVCMAPWSVVEVTSNSKGS